jgi:hypothetical protein
MIKKVDKIGYSGRDFGLLVEDIKQEAFMGRDSGAMRNGGRVSHDD